MESLEDSLHQEMGIQDGDTYEATVQLIQCTSALPHGSICVKELVLNRELNKLEGARAWVSNLLCHIVVT